MRGARIDMGMAATRVYTDEELMRLPKDGCKRELVDGEIRVMSPAGWRHSRIIVRLSRRLDAFADERGLGAVVSEEMGYRMPSGNLRLPDVSFVSAARVPKGEAAIGFFQGAPDLAVEVLSPDDRPREVMDKVGEYLAAGVRLVWVIDPEERVASVYRSLTHVREIAADGSLDGEDVVPGFSCRLAEIFE